MEDDLCHGCPGLCEVLVRTLKAFHQGEVEEELVLGRGHRGQSSQGHRTAREGEAQAPGQQACEVPQMTVQAGQGARATQPSSKLKDVLHGPESCGIHLGSQGQ